MAEDRSTDVDLMREVAIGRRDSLEQLVRRHGSELLTFIQRMVGDSSRRDDVFQDVFLSVWQKRHGYQYPRAFKPWLFKIAANKCREHFRTAGRLPAWSLDRDVVGTEDRPGDGLISQETHALVAAAVDALPESQRMVVVLRIWNGMSYAEIAEVTGRSEGTSRSLMYHALKQLREKLQIRLQ
jgi:RNA polymerase sigma-70 factor (ECF subfamily)